MKDRRNWLSAPAAIAAGVFAVFYALGSFVSAEDPNALENLSFPVFFGRAAMLYPVWYLLALAVFRAADVCRVQAREISRSRVRWVFLGALTLCWLPYFIVCFPGNLNGDTLKSILSTVNPENARNMPWALNALYGGVIRLGDRLGSAQAGLFVFCGCQALAFLWGFADLLAFQWTRGVPRACVIFSAALFGLLPALPTFAFSTVKDAAFAVCMLWMCKAGLEALTDGKAAPRRLWIEMAVSGVCMALTRNGAFWILALYAVFFIVRFRASRAFLAGGLALAAVLCFGVPKWRGEPGNQIKENLSLPLQQLARVLEQHRDALSGEEILLYESVMTREEWAEYRPGTADPVKLHFPPEAGAEDLRRFLSLWAREGARFPKTYLEAAILQNYAYYSPLADRSDIQKRLYLGTRRFKEQNAWEVAPTLKKNEHPGQQTVLDWDDFLNRVPGIRLFLRIGIYTWILAGTAVYCCARKNRRGFLAVLLPLLITAAGCLFSPVNGLYRYGVPLFVGVPGFCGACLFLRAGREKDARQPSA